MDKRFIEESFPVKEVGLESIEERKQRKGISSLHMWWARKPLGVSRATIYAALLPQPKDEVELVKYRNFIIKLSEYKNSHDLNIIEEARQKILNYNKGIKPKILDPFSGGGSIPLEALKLGCEAYANDYNPVAVLIEKCTLEYPQFFNSENNQELIDNENKLIKDIVYFSNNVFKAVKNDVGFFYFDYNKKEIPIGFYWMHTIRCLNPQCNKEIPLTNNWFLKRKKDQTIAVMPIIIEDKLNFEIVGQDNKIPEDFNPKNGTIKQTIVTCPFCKSRIDAKETRELFFQGKSEQKLVAVIYKYPNKNGKYYRIADKTDILKYKKAEEFLQAKILELNNDWNIHPIPNEIILTPDNKEYTKDGLFYNFHPVVLYGITKWKDLFNQRQKLALLSFIENIRINHKKMIDHGFEEDYVKIITSYLALIFDRLLLFSNISCRWQSGTEQNVPGFGVRNSIPMLFNYFEVNPLGNVSTSWNQSTEMIIKSIENIMINTDKAMITSNSATKLPYKDNFFDAVITDPPYYDAVPYSNLSDFFYVWLKKILGDLYPKLFLSHLTPRSDECIADLPLLRGITKEEASEKLKNIKTSEVFEIMLKNSFGEISRVLKPDGIVIMVYAYKTTDGWENVINSLQDSGLTVTASWPLHTESKEKAHAKKLASLASSIYIVARKMEKTKIGWYKDVKDEINKFIPPKLDYLWDDGFWGSDFFIGGIGFSIEIFGKYEKILDNKGNQIKADHLLEDVRSIVTDYAMKQILHNGISHKISPLTKFYLLWRWNYQESSVSFDDAIKLAQSAGIDLVKEWNKGFISKSGKLVKIKGPLNRTQKSLENSYEMIDVLHNICILWKEGKRDNMKKILEKSGFINNDTFYKVAQAISETLPRNSSEKKLIEGFLASKNHILGNFGEKDNQSKFI